jgi:hypothetical protein
MSARPPIQPISAQGRINALAHSCVARQDILALNNLAVRSLASLFNEKERLFYRRVTLMDDRYHPDATSRKHTIIALLGLQRLAESGERLPFDITSIRNAVLEDTKWVRSFGDLGLLAWFTAECVPERLVSLLNEFDFGKALDTHPDNQQSATQKLAWFLTGISHARLTSPGALPDLTDIAVDTYHSLQNNQSVGGLFGGGGSSGFLQQILGNRFGTFADQIFAIYALTAFARAFQIEEPLESALSCANSVRALQGELGQWWFLYDKEACRIVNRYPVCSVHQDGLAPMALLALGDITGQSFHEPVHKGLSWIAGANEIEADLRSSDQGFIWDSIGRKSTAARYQEAALSFVNVSRDPQREGLRIQYEARPDHFGWLLYAFGKLGLPKTAASAKAASTG